jgi:sporulation protein YlmC with PRC-barrel domain
MTIMAKTTIVAVTTALLLGGVAFAQDTTTTTTPAPGTPTSVPEQTGGTPIPNSVDPATTAPGAGTGSEGTSAAEDAPMVDPSMADGTRTTEDPASPTAVPGADPTAGTTGTTADAPTTMPAAPATTAADGGWRSYESMKDQFTGEITGGFAADDLIGANVVDQEGNSVGEVSDLVVGSDQRVQHVIVDVGGFLGLGQKPVAIQLDQLRKSDESSSLMVTMSKDQIEDMPSVSRDDDGLFSTSS